MEQKRKSKNSFPLKQTLVAGFITALVVILLSYFNLLGGLERSALDLRFMLRGELEPDPDILIIGITEDCLAELGRWPWDRDIHAQLLDVLTENNIAAIGMDILFVEPDQNTEMDQALIEATARSAPVIYALNAPPEISLEVPGFLTPRYLSMPIEGLQPYSRAGFVNVTPDMDSVLRRTILWMELEGWPITSFDMLLWQSYLGEDINNFYDHLDEVFEPNPSHLDLGENKYPLDPGGLTLINYSGKAGNFPVLPYHIVVAGEYPPSTFEGKVVLVGYYAPGMGDYYFTPYSPDEPMYGVEVHANILNMLMSTGPIHSLPLSFELFLIFFLVMGSMFLYQGLKPTWGALSLLLLVITYYSITWHLFNNRSLNVETVYPLIALSASYLVTLAYKYIVEQREKMKVTRLFGRYVAPQVVDEILEIGEENLKLGGTKRRISLLFIDIRGFTPLSEKMSPEGIVAILNEYFELVTRCVFENKGTIDKFMGDAAMALFNAPLLLDDHSLWAVKAAKAIVEEGEALRKKVKDMSGVTLQFGVGINTGDVVVGNIGAENRMEYTAIGDAVNLAARLESNAKPGQVLVSPEVFKEVDGRLPLNPVGEITVKGKAKPIMVYELEYENKLS